MPFLSSVLAMGCFWCGEADFEKIGCAAESGYAGGTVNNPSYSAVVGGGTGHYEVVKVKYDANLILGTAKDATTNQDYTITGYDALLYKFWTNVDPTDGTGQFCDQGPGYRAAIFVSTLAERQRAERSLEYAIKVFTELGGASSPNAIRANVPIIDAKPESSSDPARYQVAENYHQDFWRVCDAPCESKYGACCDRRYYYYRNGCRRDEKLAVMWGGGRREKLGEYLLGGTGWQALADLKGKKACAPAKYVSSGQCFGSSGRVNTKTSIINDRDAKWGATQCDKAEAPAAPQPAAPTAPAAPSAGSASAGGASGSAAGAPQPAASGAGAQPSGGSSVGDPQSFVAPAGIYAATGTSTQNTTCCVGQDSTSGVAGVRPLAGVGTVAWLALAAGAVAWLH